jgi:hypothetical protein
LGSYDFHVLLTPFGKSMLEGFSDRACFS